MKKYIYNLSLHTYDTFRKIKVNKYSFSPYKRTKQPSSSMRIYTPQMAVRYNRDNVKNAYVNYSGRQKESILFRDGFAAQYTKRKLLDDVLLVMSLLSGKNIEYASRKVFPAFPLASSNHLELVSWTWQQLSKDTVNILTIIKDKAWLNKYQRGFHLRMLYNHANVSISETRFLAMVVIWEWMFTQEFGRESGNLREIISELLKKFWPSLTNSSIFNSNSQNIITVLRNQLAHVGTLPIDRPYSEQWMTQLSGDAVGAYMKLFGQMTQMLVFKTLGIDLLKRQCFKTLSVDVYFKELLTTGQVNRFNQRA